MRRPAATQRCGECDGVQPLRARECEICGAALDGSTLMAEPPKPLPTWRPARSSVETPRRVGLRWRTLLGSWRRALALVAGWGLLLAALTMAASLALTFADGAGVLGAGTAAAWRCLRAPLLLSATAALLAAATFDLIQMTRGRPGWSARPRDLLLTLAVPVLFLVGAAGEGAVPPSAWHWVPWAAATGLVTSLALRLVGDLVASGGLRRLITFVGVAALLGVAWLFAPRNDVPSRAEQVRLDRRLEAAVPLRRCRPRSIGALPDGLLRNSLVGFVHCHRGPMQATFMLFRNASLLDVYVAGRKHEVEGRSEDPAERCDRRRGAYADEWFKEARPNRALGDFLCFGRGRRRSVIQWEDSRSLVFGDIRGRPRLRLYHWWHLHQVNPLRLK